MRYALLVLSLAATACGIRPARLGTDSASGQSKVKRAEFAEKIVNMKRAPLTLVARDGSRCQVDGETYRATRVGDRATCMWEF